MGDDSLQSRRVVQCGSSELVSPQIIVGNGGI